MEKLVIGLVQTHDEAEAAAERIIDCGYTRQEVSLLMTEATRDRCFPSLDIAPPSSTFGAAVSMSVVVPDLGFVVAGPAGRGRGQRGRRRDQRAACARSSSPRASRGTGRNATRPASGRAGSS